VKGAEKQEHGAVALKGRESWGKHSQGLDKGHSHTHSDTRTRVTGCSRTTSAELMHFVAHTKMPQKKFLNIFAQKCAENSLGRPQATALTPMLPRGNKLTLK